MPASRSSQIASPHNRSTRDGQQPSQDSHSAAHSTHSEEPSSDLSKRELQIVELVAAGLTNQEISEQLAISKRTVDNHVSNVLSKTGSANRVALVRWALQSGKVCIDELNCCRLPEPDA